MSNGNVSGMLAENEEVSSPDEWYEEAEVGVKYRLPGSGKIMELVRPGLQGMIAAGHVNNFLTPEVMRFLATEGQDLAALTTASATGPGQSAAETQKIEGQKIAIYKRNARAFAQLFAACVTRPKVLIDGTPNRAAGEISIKWVPDLDITWVVFTFLQGNAERLSQFRVSATNGDARPGGSQVREITVGDGSIGNVAQ